MVDLYKDILETRTPNYYDILGLKLFESDIKIIHGAGLEQTGKLKQWDIARDEDVAQKAHELQEQISAALTILEDPNKKSEYDKQLSKELGIPIPEKVQSPEQPDIQRTIPETDTLKRKRNIIVGTVLAAAFVFVCFFAYAMVNLMLSFSSDDEANEQTAKGEEAAVSTSPETSISTLGNSFQEEKNITENENIETSEKEKPVEVKKKTENNIVEKKPKKTVATITRNFLIKKSSSSGNKLSILKTTPADISTPEKEEKTNTMSRINSGSGKNSKGSDDDLEPEIDDEKISINITTNNGTTYHDAKVVKTSSGYYKVIHKEGSKLIKLSDLPTRSITTRDGKRFTKVKITNITPTGLDITHSDGIKFIAFKDLPDKIQAEFNYSKSKEERYREKRKRELAAWQEKVAERTAKEKEELLKTYRENREHSKRISEYGLDSYSGSRYSSGSSRRSSSYSSYSSSSSRRKRRRKKSIIKDKRRKSRRSSSSSLFGN